MGRDERCWALSRRTDAEVAVRRRTRAAVGRPRLWLTEPGKGITMRFGHFDDEAREYVITTPHTPYPSINYLGSQEFFSLISHQAGGYSFYRDARMRRLTRYLSLIHISEPTRLGMISYAVFCLKKKKKK